jgi:cytochrome c oxidase assembly protein subunit 11
MVTTQARSNLLTMRKLLIVAVAMFGFGFALVPFYKKICEVTGVNSVLKADEVSNTQIDLTRQVTIELDSNLRSNLPWTFPGELTTVMYEIRNTSDHVVTGQAIPSYGPQLAVRYFKKLDCFCFTQQTLKAGEVREMPVVFVIDRELPVDVNTITLSYTFFEVEGTAKTKS